MNTCLSDQSNSHASCSANEWCVKSSRNEYIGGNVNRLNYMLVAVNGNKMKSLRKKYANDVAVNRQVIPPRRARPPALPRLSHPRISPFHPPISPSAHQTCSPTHLACHSIPPGTSICIPINRLPCYWGTDADTFDPERRNKLPPRT